MSCFINIKKKLLLIILLIISFLLVAGCSDSEVTGTGSQAGNGIITAVVVYNDNNIAANAEVYIRKSDFLKDINDNSEDSTITLTDSKGHLIVEIDSDIEYVLEIKDGKGYANLTICSTNAFLGDTLNLDTLYLEEEALFSGEVDVSNIPDSVPVYVQVYGMNKIQKVDSLGYFKFENFPSGSYNLKLLPGHPDYLPVDSQQIALGPNDSLEAGLFLLPQDAWKDTLVVREILDLNNLDTLGVESVVDFDPTGRITDLILLEKGIDTLPPTVGRLRLKTIILAGNRIVKLPEEIGRMLSLEYLDLAKNNIDLLPKSLLELRNLRHLDLNDNILNELPYGIGKMKYLHRISCRSNSLKTLPPSLGMIKHLKVLDFYDNDISNIPIEVTYLKELDILDVQYNRLQFLPFEIEVWINEYSISSEWKATQRK